MPLFLQGQIWTLMTSPHFFNLPCPTTILFSMTEFTNKSMAVRWVVLSASCGQSLHGGDQRVRNL